MPAEDEPAQVKKAAPAKRGCLRRLVVLGLILFGLLALLNGPGARLILRYVALDQLENRGVTGDLEVTGSLLFGIGVSNARLRGDGLIEEIDVGDFRIRWSLPDLLRKQVKAVEGDGIRVALNLGVANSGGESGEEPEDEVISEAVDPVDVVESIRSLLSPIRFDLRDIELEIQKEGEPFIVLGPTHIGHDTDEAGWEVDLGKVEVPGKLPGVDSQKIGIEWGEDLLGLDRIQWVDRWVLEKVRVRSKLGEADLIVSRADSDLKLQVQTRDKFSSVRLRLVEGTLDVGSALAPWVKDFPLEARIPALEAKLNGLDEGLEGMGVELFVETRDVSWEEWQLDRFAVSARGGSGEMAGELGMAWQGTEVSTKYQVDRRKEGQEVPWWTSARLGLRELRVDSISGAGKTLRSRFAPQYDANPFPEGSLAGEATLAWGEPGFEISSLEITAPDWKVESETLPPLLVGGSMIDAVIRGGNVKVGGGDVPLVSLRGEADLNARGYDGELTLSDSFSTDWVQSICKVIGVDAVSDLSAGLRWKGSGNWGQGSHDGALEFSVPKQEVMEFGSATASGEIRYSWPDSVAVKRLDLDAMGLKSQLVAHWSEERLVVDQLAVATGEQPYLSATASIPLSMDSVSRGKILEQDGEISADLSVPRRSFASLAAFSEVPELPVEGDGEIACKIGGTLLEPTLEGKIQAKVTRVTAAPEFPETVVDVDFTTRKQTLRVDGKLRQTDYGPVALEVDLPLRVEKWIEDPESFLRDEWTAKASLPRLGLDRYASLVPGIEKLGGGISGEIDFSGSVEQPVVKGRLSLTDGLVQPENPSVASVRNADVVIGFDSSTLRIEKGMANVSGGDLQLAGSVDYSDLEKVQVDVSVRGDHILLWRDDMALVRASPRLKFTGTPGDFRLSGTFPIVDSLVYKDVQIIPLGANLGLPSRPAAARIDAVKMEKETGGFSSGVSLDILVTSPDRIRIAGNLATGKINSRIRVSGTLAKPELDGALGLRETEAKLPFSTVRLDRGRVIFTPKDGLTPRLDIAGRSRVNPYDINILVQGNVSKPKVVLTSEPPLPENEIMSLLATGATTSSLGKENSASSRATQLLISELRRGRIPHGKRIAKLLEPFEDVQIGVGQENPYTGTSLNSASLPIGERFLLTGAVDQEGNPRGTLTFFLKFR